MKNKSFPATAAPRHAILLSLTSASVLAYEILLMRLLSIGQWHHLAYMVISLALLGFGAAGSFLFLLFGRIRKNLDGWLVLLAGVTSISFSLFFSLSQKVDLDPHQLIYQPAQWVNMLFTYLLMSVPFLLAGGIVGIVLTAAGEKAHRFYAADLLGAGCGVSAIVPALYLAPPWRLLPFSGGVVLFGAILCCLRMRRPIIGIVTLLVSAGVLIIVNLGLPPVPKIHDTKALPMTLALPDARIEARVEGPLGMIHVVGSSLIRHAPGLSWNFGLHQDGKKASLPKQKAIFIDADCLGPVAMFTGDPDELEYLDYTTMALPYHIRKPDKALVIGAGGGSDVLLGLRHETPKIIALEANKQIAELLTGTMAEFSGHLYSRPQVKLKKREGRQFLHSTEERFDLIQLSLLDSYGVSAGGLHSATESYLYTIEAFEQYLSHLTETGLLAITRWLKLPPRDSLRVMATALIAIRRMDLTDRPEQHLIFIRSWKTSTIIVSKSPFIPGEIDKAAVFCDERSFDLAYYAGMEMERANRYDVHGAPYYFIGARLLSGHGAESFTREYAFDISPTTDNRPYFSHFFRWDKAQDLFKHLRREWLPMVESGYIFILAALIQAILAGCMFILMPLLFIRRVHRESYRGKHVPRWVDILVTLLYFWSIGMAFMLLEMAIFPRYILLLSNPVYSAAVVLSTVLVFAGCGSLSVRRLQAFGSCFLWIPVIVVTIWVGLHTVAGDWLFENALKCSIGGRVALAVLMLSLISFFLGWPFPSGLRVTAKRFPNLVPWAWGINGCASVMGAVLGKFLAVSLGFKFLMFAACALYIFAIAVFHMGLRDVIIKDPR